MKQLNPCRVTGCPRNKQVTSRRGFCHVHEDLVDTILWVLNNIVHEAKPGKKSGLVVPGDKEFRIL